MIVKTADTCGGSARIDGTRVAVWIVDTLSNSGMSYEEIGEYYPHLTDEQIYAALKYADQHREEIAQDILKNTTDTPTTP